MLVLKFGRWSLTICESLRKVVSVFLRCPKDNQDLGKVNIDKRKVVKQLVHEALKHRCSVSECPGNKHDLKHPKSVTKALVEI